VTPAAADAAARLRVFEHALNCSFVERRHEIRALLLALVAREHVLLLGDPGTGKSALTNAFAAALSGRFFGVLMTRFSVPEEVFGPISLVGLEQDQYRRVVDGYLPTATVAFLDEVFKANSAILNSLLTILNERAYDNGGTRSRVPLELAVGASNELPEDSALDALYDRFLVRRWVCPVADRDALRRLLLTRGEPTSPGPIAPDDLAAVRGLADAVIVPDDVVDAILDIKDALIREHGVSCSDRRWRKMVALVRANAALAGRDAAEREDVAVLVDAIWRKPDERPAIAGTVMRIAAPELGEATRTLDAAIETYNAAMGAVAKRDQNAVGKANRELKDQRVAVGTLRQSAQVAEIGGRIEAMQKAVARKFLEMVGA